MPPLFTSSFPFEPRRVGAAAVYCSDGRYGEQMDEFLHQHLKLPEYDRVAMPGGCAALASHFVTMREEMALDRQLRFLITSHALHTVVLIAHQDCGYYKQIRLRYKTLEEQQTADLMKAAERIRTYTANIEVSAYFTRRDGEKVFFDKIAI
jgi:hypothetical protein